MENVKNKWIVTVIIITIKIKWNNLNNINKKKRTKPQKRSEICFLVKTWIHQSITFLDPTLQSNWTWLHLSVSAALLLSADLPWSGAQQRLGGLGNLRLPSVRPRLWAAQGPNCHRYPRRREGQSSWEVSPVAANPNSYICIIVCWAEIGGMSWKQQVVIPV